VALGVRDRQRRSARELRGDLDVRARVAPIGPTTKKIAPIGSPRASSGWTMRLRAPIASTISAISAIPPVARRSATGIRQVFDQDRPAGADGTGRRTARTGRRRERA
jgi:hypothetical protein